MDITSIPMARGFVHLTTVLGWFSRKVLARRLAITRSPDFCIETLKDALGRSGRPEIFNSDQGSQFTGVAFITALKNAEIAISMDGRGSAHTPRARQRLRRAALADGEPKDPAAKYEKVSLRPWGSVSGPGPRLAAMWASPTAPGRIRRPAGRRLIRPVSASRCQSRRRRNQDGNPFGRTPDTGQTKQNRSGELSSMISVHAAE
ncbi:transposase family protein [Paracoccus sp. MC1854]|nr:transposase family protein [Paracoccus sp. MC1854]